MQCNVAAIGWSYDVRYCTETAQLVYGAENGAQHYKTAIQEIRMTRGPRVKCNLNARIDNIRMSNADRETAKTYLRQGAFVADVTLRTLGGLRLLAAYARRRVRWLLRVTH